MNIPRLEAIKDHIRAHPESFDMDIYHNDCGTVGCLAGHAIFMFGDKEAFLAKRERLIKEDDKKAYYKLPAKLAEDILDLTHKEGLHLFIEEEWPEGFREEYYDAFRDTKERAEIAIRRIDHFIATEGQE